MEACILIKFQNLDISKKQKIINIAIHEFMKHGYEKASTNTIAKESSISKGSLFNYFLSKKQLFKFLIDYSVDIIELLYLKIDQSERDLFLRLENIGIQKLEIQVQHPNIFDFIKSIKHEESEEVKPLIQSKFTIVASKGIEKIYQDIDFSKFRDDIDINKAIEIINWAMFGFSEKALSEIDSFTQIPAVGEKYLNDWREYSRFLKKLFYK